MSVEYPKNLGRDLELDPLIKVTDKEVTVGLTGHRPNKESVGVNNNCDNLEKNKNVNFQGGKEDKR